MGTRVSDSTRYQIIALLNSGKNSSEIARATGTSVTYVKKLCRVLEMVRCEQWEKLIDFSHSYYVSESMLNFISNFVSVTKGKGVPDNVRQEVLSVSKEKPKPEEPKPEEPKWDNNAATAMVNILSQLNSISQMLEESADDICQTDATSRKLLEQKIDANFDVLCRTIRDGFESVKTTIRKVNKQ